MISGEGRQRADHLQRLLALLRGKPLCQRHVEMVAIIFDNLHSLHDVVSDILADERIPRSEKRRRILDAAAQYRDDVTSVVSVPDWKAMADAMGLANMGGPAPITSDARR